MCMASYLGQKKVNDLIAEFRIHIYHLSANKRLLTGIFKQPMKIPSWFLSNAQLGLLHCKSSHQYCKFHMDNLYHHVFHFLKHNFNDLNHNFYGKS